MTVSELQQNKMGYKPMLPLVFGMSLPAIFSMLIQALYNIVDSIFVSNYNEDAFTAISLVMPLQMVAISFAVGTAVGVNSLIARRLGAKDYREADNAATTGLFLAVCNWLLFIVVGLTLSGPFVAAFHDDPTVITYGTQYLTIVLCVSFGMMFSVMGEKILQATGNMIFPMLTQMLGAVVNIIMDPLLIFGIGFFPELGIVGAAVATVFGQICSMIFILIVLFVKKHAVTVRLKGFRPSGQVIRNIYAVGFPAIVMQSIGSVMVSGINAIISTAQVSRIVADAYIRSFGAYFKLQSFIFMPVFGLNQGVMPIIGFNYGAGNKKRLYAAFRIGLIVAATIMAFGTLLFQLAPGWLLSFFKADEQMLAVGEPTLRTISLSFMLAAVGIMFSSLFQAVGKGFYSMVMSVARQLVVLLPVAYLLAQANLSSMWYAFPIAEFACLGIAIVFFIILQKKQLRKLS